MNNSIEENKINNSFDYKITKNIKTIEWLKVELLNSISSLFKFLQKGAYVSQDIVIDCLSGIIILTYLIAKRVGIEYSIIDSKIESKVKLGVVEQDNIEKEYGDLSSLLNYIKSKNSL